MRSETLDLILRMRDQASAVWKKFEGGVRGGAQKLGSFLSNNWAGIGAGMAGALFIATKALEKLDQIAKKVAKSAKDIDAQHAAEQLQKVAQYAEDAQGLVDQLIVRGSLFAVGVGNAVATFFATLYTIILTPLARIEEGLNLLGITSGKTLQNLRDVGVEHMKAYSKAATDAFSAALASSKDLGIGIEENFEEWEKGQKIAEAVAKAMQSTSSAPISIPVKVTPVMNPETFNKAMAENWAAQEAIDTQQAEVIKEIYLASLKTQKEQEFEIIDEWSRNLIAKAQGDADLIAEIQRIAAERRAEVETQANEERLKKEIETAQKIARQAQQIGSQAVNVIMGFHRNQIQAEIAGIEESRDASLQAIDDQLASETLSEQDRNRLLDIRKQRENEYQSQIRSAKQRQFIAERTASIIQSIMQTAVAVVEALPNIPLSIAVGILGAAQTAVIAGQPTPRFHGGGSYTNLGPDERQIIVRENERVDVTRPDQVGGGTYVTVNINAPGTTKEMVKQAIEEGLRETGLTVDKYLVNQRNRAVLS